HGTLRSIAQRRNRAIIFLVKRPADNRRRVLTPRAPLTLPSLQAAFPGRPAAAGTAHELPAIAGANSWIITACTVGSVLVFDDIKLSVFFVDIECAAGSRRQPITTSTRDADPISTTRGLCGVLARLPERAVVANDLRFIGDALGLPKLSDRQLARHR